MFSWIRSLFSKQPPATYEIEADEVFPRRTTHVFDENQRDESSYCTILNFSSDPGDPGILKAKLVWRTPYRVEKGDTIILRNMQHQRTFRVITIVESTREASVGVAYTFL